MASFYNDVKVTMKKQNICSLIVVGDFIANHTDVIQRLMNFGKSFYSAKD